ncbi:hypothetical protein ABBQ32_010194 [Trebouxia sp. C0010 RCD-2024]
MDQRQISQVLAMEVQSNTTDFHKFKQKSELEIQALKTKHTVKDSKIDELTEASKIAFKVFELERSALTALLLTERGDSRVLARELHRKVEALDGFWCKHWQTVKDLEQRLSQARQERKQYMLQCGELQDAQQKLTLQLEDQCKDLEQRLSQALQERQQYKLQCEELQDAHGNLTLQFENQCKADKEAQEKALQRQQERQDLAEQLQLLQGHNNTLAQQLASLQAEKLAMDKALEQQDHMKKVQLQEDQSSSLVQQLADVKLEVVKAACKRDKEVQDTWKLKTSGQRSAFQAAEKALRGIQKSTAPGRNAKALAPSSPPNPTSPHAPKVAPHLAPHPPPRRQGQATTAQLKWAFSGLSPSPPRSEGPPPPPPPRPEGPPPPPPRPRGASTSDPLARHGPATASPYFATMGPAGRMGFAPVAPPHYMLHQQAGMYGTTHPAYRT